MLLRKEKKMDKVFMNDTGDTLHIRIPVSFRRNKYQKTIVAPNGRDLTENFKDSQDTRDHVLLGAVAQGFQWQRMLDNGKYQDIQQLAKAVGVEYTIARQTIRLTLLAPDIVKSILQGTQPVTLSLRSIRGGFPMVWQEQRETFGYS